MFRALALAALLATTACSGSAETTATTEDEGLPKMGGLGIKVGTLDGRLMVNEVITPGPAAEAGMQAGDELIVIDDIPLEGANMQVLMGLAIGPADSVAQVTVRGADGAERTLSVTRWDVDRLMQSTK